jgi:TolB-like protein/Flp pilus assembly protein TadD
MTSNAVNFSFESTEQRGQALNLLAELKRRNVVRVGIAYVIVAWLLLQVTDLVLENINAPDWVMQVFMLAIAIGFPIVLIFAWAFELTPEGIKREKDVDRTQSVTPQTGRKLDRAIIVVLALAVAFLLYQQFSGQPSAPDRRPDQAAVAATPGPERVESATTEKSIAVLPFRDMSAAQDQAYFGEGIAEELLNALAELDGLKVASRTSAFSVATENLDIPTIAERLSVNHILEGSVRTSGNRVRVTAQLIDVAEDAHLWSETYDGNLDDIFQIQDEITRKITAAMKVQLGKAPLASAANELTKNAEAYQLYLQGRHLWRQRNGAAIERAVELFKQAVALDPEFHQAWSNLAVAYLNLPDYAVGYNVEETFELGLAAADRALALDPGSTEARIIRANYLEFHCDFLGGAAEYEAAIANDPDDPTARHWYAILLMTAGRAEQALTHIETARRLDPLISAVTIINAGALAQQGKYEQAIQLARKAAALGFEDGSPVEEAKFRILAGQAGEGAGLLREAARRTDLMVSAEQLNLFADAAENPGKLPDFVAYAETRNHDDPYTTVELADELAILGSKAAIEVLNSMSCPQGGQAIWMPAFRAHRATPEFFELAKRAGYVDYWREYGWPDDCASLDPSLAECPE